MTIREILNTTQHRPFNLPPESWKYYQEWNNVIFLHWQVELDELKKYVPKELTIDLFNGSPWVSVVAFTMEKVRLKYLPSFPPISNFDEINIRTYVTSGNKSGVYFLSIEGGTNISCKIAKGISSLPYRFSTMKRTDTLYQSNNLEYNEKLEIEYNIGEKIKSKLPLDKWLTERYALFQDTKACMNEFEIHHEEWPLHEIELSKLEFRYPRFKNLIKRLPDKVQYSKGVKVIAWGKKQRDKNDINE